MQLFDRSNNEGRKLAPVNAFTLRNCLHPNEIYACNANLFTMQNHKLSKLNGWNHMECLLFDLRSAFLPIPTAGITKCSGQWNDDVHLHFNAEFSIWILWKSTGYFAINQMEFSWNFSLQILVNMCYYILIKQTKNNCSQTQVNVPSVYHISVI